MTDTTTSPQPAARAAAQPRPARPPRAEPEPLNPALHSRYYTDADVLALEQERIFNRTWQVVAHESDLPNPGSRVVGLLGSTEVVVVRTETGEIRAHVNTCRHRGTRLVAEPGEEKALRCPYHGWTYHLDGELVGAPEGRSIPCLDKAKLGLFPARVEVISGLVFANLDPGAEPLAPQLADIRPLLDRYLSGPLEQFSDYRLHKDEPKDEQAANWKVVVDNYLEGYHVPVAHPGLMRLLDYKKYGVTTSHAYALYEAPLRDKPSDNWSERMYQRLVRPMPGLLPEDERVFRYIAIYPNTVIDLYPDHVLIWKMNPHGVDRTGVPGAYLRRTDGDPRTRAAQWLNLRISQITTHEDEDLVGRMQRGLSNGDFTPGPLSLREAGVAWFAGRIRDDLGELGE
jgi:Rieske 2Fe-2S family protein